MNEGSQRQRRVGDPAGDHDLRALAQGFDDRCGAEIGIGGHQQFFVRQVLATGAQYVEALGTEHIVAGDHADPGARSGLRNETCNHLRCRGRICRPKIADDRDVVLEAVLQDWLEQGCELRLVADRWIFAPAQLRGGQCALAQGLEDDGGALAGGPQIAHHRKWRIEPVARIAGTRADEHAPAHV